MYYDLYRWTIGFAGSVFVLSGINLLMNVTVNKFKTAKNLVGGVGTLSMGIYAVQGYVFQYVIIPVFAIVGVDVPFKLYSRVRPHKEKINISKECINKTR